MSRDLFEETDNSFSLSISLFRCVKHVDAFLRFFSKSLGSFIDPHGSRQEETVFQRSSGAKRKSDNDCRRRWRERDNNYRKYRCYQWIDSHHRQSSWSSIHYCAGET